MKVLIKAETGPTVGLGHLVRCTAIQQALTERGVDARFCLDGADGEEYLQELGIPYDLRPLDDTPRCDVLLVDSYSLPLAFYERAAGVTALLVSLDDNLRLPYPSGLVVNGTIYAQSLPYPARASVRYLLGPRFACLRRDFWAVPPRNTRGTLRRVGFILGGTGADVALALARGLALRRRDLEVHVVAVKRPTRTAVPRVAIRGPLSGAQMRDFMLYMDVVVCGGGQTPYELARCGVPALALRLADNQTRNIEALSAAGIVEVLGPYDSATTDDALLAALGRMDFSRRRRVCDLGRRLVDGKGAARVADEMVIAAGGA